MWLTVLFSLLSLFLEWWLNKKKSGVPLSDREKRLGNRFLAIAAQITPIAQSMGCAPSMDDIGAEQMESPRAKAILDELTC